MSEEVVGLVSAHPFFAGLSVEQKVMLSGDGMSVSFAAGERIFVERLQATRLRVLNLYASPAQAGRG